MKEKTIRSMTMEIMFECGGRVSANIDYRSIRPNNNVLAKSTSTIMRFMLESSDSNIMDQLPLDIPVMVPNDKSKKEDIDPFSDKEKWINLRKRKFATYLYKYYNLIETQEPEIRIAIDKKFQAMFDISIFTLLATETGKNDLLEFAERDIKQSTGTESF